MRREDCGSLQQVGRYYPQYQAKAMIKQLHQWTHLGAKKLVQMVLKSKNHVLGLRRVTKQVVQQCQPCQKVNACRNRMEPGTRLRGDRRGVFWEVDFTEVIRI